MIKLRFNHDQCRMNGSSTCSLLFKSGESQAMAPHHIIIFGEPEVRKNVINLVGGGGVTDTPELVFQSTHYEFSTESDGSNFHLYDTAGLDEILSPPNPVTTFTSLYKFVSTLSFGISLLVYAVQAQPKISDYTLFGDILCQNCVPIILIRTQSPLDTRMEEPGMRFKQCLVLPDSGTSMQKTLLKYALKSLWKPERMDWFTKAIIQSWSLFRKLAGWTPTDCNNALYVTLESAGLSSADAKNKRKEIVKHMR